MFHEKKKNVYLSPEKFTRIMGERAAEFILTYSHGISWSCSDLRTLTVSDNSNSDYLGSVCAKIRTNIVRIQIRNLGGEKEEEEEAEKIKHPSLCCRFFLALR